jgi:hypothetical protein
MACGRVYIKQNPLDAELTATELIEKMKEHGFMKKVLAYSASLRGTSSYWYTQCHHVEAMCEQLGPPTFFTTLSSADTHWPDLKQLWQASQVCQLPERMRLDPVMADYYFTKRFELYLKYFFVDYLKCKDYYVRIEYQHRGSPHCHGLGWMANGPNITKKPIDLQAIADYADRYLSTVNPVVDFHSIPGCTLRDTPNPLDVPYQDVNDLQHDYGSMLNICMRHTKCSEGRCLKSRKLANGLVVTNCRFKFPKPLIEKTVCHYVNIASTISTDDPQEEPTVRLVVETKRNDPLLVSHSPAMLSTWRANCEMQLITNVDAIRRYVVKYLTKGEPLSTYMTKLQQTAAKNNNCNASSKRVLQSLLMSTIACRDYSAQECGHHLLRLPLNYSTRVYEHVNTSGIRGIDENGVLPNHLDRYSKRHESLDNMNLFQYVQTYNTNSPIGSVPPKRRIPAIVVVKPRLRSNIKRPALRELYYQQQLMLYVPWRNIQTLQGENETWELAFTSANITSPLIMHMDDNDDANAPDNANEMPLETEPYHVGTVGEPHPEAEEQADWMEIVGDPIKLFTDAEGNVNVYAEFTNDPSFDWTVHNAEWNLTTIETFLPEAKLRTPKKSLDIVDISLLNSEQKNIYDHVVNQELTNTQHPLRALVLGTAGTGKSFLIHAIRSLFGEACTVVAPTGVAASNINGQTIHSMFGIPVQGFKDLSSDVLMDMQTKWTAIKVIIVDEISMVGQNMLGMMDSRLRQLFPADRDTVFGRRSVIFFGDFGQLPPVMDKPLYSNQITKKPLVLQGRLAYQQVNKVFFLTIVVRQDGDSQFRDLLLSLRDGNVSLPQWKLLCSRDNVNHLSSDEPFKSALSLFPTRKAVLHHNLNELRKSTNQIAVINADHPGRDKVSKQATSDDAGGLEAQIALCVGAKVMLTTNLWIECNLVNGSVGFVEAIVYDTEKTPPQLPLAVFVKFVNYTGPVLSGGVVPILPKTFHWNNKKHHCSRTQIPLVLSWANTIHKAQGLTLDAAIVNLGNKEMCSGLSFVALSRVRKLTDLCIYPCNFDRLLKISSTLGLSERKSEEEKLKNIVQ